MYTVQTRQIVKRPGGDRKIYFKRQYSSRLSAIWWVNKLLWRMPYRYGLKHAYITVWDDDNDIIYNQHDDEVEMYDAKGNPVDDLDDIGR